MSAETWARKLNDAAVGRALVVRGDELAALMGETAGVDPKLLDARAQKAALVWVKGKLDAEPSFAQRFDDKSGIPWLDKLLTVARLKELASVKIVKAGKSSGLRYDIGGLGSTWYGRRILDGLGFNRRRTSATKEEFATIVAACARIKLKLPQSVEPTTTERFFAE
jgi:hypothetical protein